LMSYFRSYEVLYFYMICIHVPNHYRMSNYYLKHDIRSFIFMCFCGLLCSTLKIKSFEELGGLIFNPLLQAIIFGHIIYQEVYVIQRSYSNQPNKNLLFVGNPYP
jgi:hypothetical protein